MTVINEITTNNNDNFTVCDISSEVGRIYFYQDKGSVAVPNPKTLWFKTGKRQDSHRILREDGCVQYIPAGWSSFVWLPKDPNDPVQF